MSTATGRRQTSTYAAIDILPPESHRDNVVRFRRAAEIVDAHFVPVGEAFRQPPQPASRSQNDNRFAARPKPATTTSDSSKDFWARPAAVIEARLMRLSPDTFLALVAAISVAVFILFGGLSLISDNSRPAETGPALDITHVTMTPQDANGMRVLLINGIVENRTQDLLDMPSIRADLVSGDLVVASTLISTSAAKIGGQESYGFSARVPHPGGKLPDLKLSLAERSPEAAGTNSL